MLMGGYVLYIVGGIAIAALFGGDRPKSPIAKQSKLSFEDWIERL
jgi:hypothetical protein